MQQKKAWGRLDRRKTRNKGAHSASGVPPKSIFAQQKSLSCLQVLMVKKEEISKRFGEQKLGIGQNG